MDLEKADGAKSKEILADFLAKYKNPVFGVLPKKEIDILVVGMMQQLGLLSISPSVYELVSKLKISRSKAQSIIYEMELRRFEDEKIRVAMIEAIFNRPIIHKQGELYCFQIENPVVIDYLREQLKLLGHSMDTSFSTSIARLSVEAIASLMEKMLPPEEKEMIMTALQKRGVNCPSMRNLLKGAVLKLVDKFTGKAGEAFVEKYAEEEVGKLFTSGCKQLTGFWDNFVTTWEGEKI